MSEAPFKDIIKENFTEWLYQTYPKGNLADNEIRVAFIAWRDCTIHTLSGTVFELKENSSLNIFEIIRYFESQLFLVKKDFE